LNNSHPANIVSLHCMLSEMKNDSFTQELITHSTFLIICLMSWIEIVHASQTWPSVFSHHLFSH